MNDEVDIKNTLCVICQEENDDGLRECQSGIPKLIEYGRLFGLKILKSYLLAQQKENSSVKVHINCQKNVGNLIRKKKANPDYQIEE